MFLSLYPFSSLLKNCLGSKISCQSLKWWCLNHGPIHERLKAVEESLAVKQIVLESFPFDSIKAQLQNYPPPPPVYNVYSSVFSARNASTTAIKSVPLLDLNKMESPAAAFFSIAAIKASFEPEKY